MITRTVGVVVCILAASCVDNADVQSSSLIRVFTTTPASLPADGVSQSKVELCTTNDAGRDPKLAASLTLSDGEWVAAADGMKTITKTLFGPDGCAHLLLRAPQASGQLVIRATLGETAFASDTRAITLTAAPLAEPHLALSAQISKTATSTVTVTVTLKSASTGKASLGTTVSFAATPSPTGVAYFTSPTQDLTSGDSVASTLVTGAGLDSVTIKVMATPPGGVAVAAPDMVVPAL